MNPAMPSSAEWHYLRAMALLVGAVEVKGDTYEALHRKTSERIEAMKNPQQKGENESVWLGE